MSIARRLGFAAALALSLPIAVVADTLVMRDGSRVNGQVVAIRNGVIEFEERRSSGTRTLRVDREEVARIEFEENRTTNNNGSFGGRPGGMRERTVNVIANQAWTDSGIDVRSGQTIYFEADGEVTWGRDRRDGPGGEKNSPSNPGRPMPNRPAAALIGRVGEGSSYFFIGDESGPVQVRGSGRLYLGINDDVLTDNRNSFRVIVFH